MMNIKHIKHIIWREFSTRVRKKSFIMTSVLGPIAMLVMMIVPYWVSTGGNSQNTYKVLALGCDNQLEEALQNNDQVSFNFACSDFDSIYLASYDAIYDSKNSKWIYHNTNDMVFDYVHARIAMYSSGDIMKIPNIQLDQVAGDNNKKQTVRTFVAYGSAIMIYFFIFLYGMQVMKGVIEEKNNRIIEVLITMVKPFELMIGKIVGIGLLGLIQFLFWALCYSIILLIFNAKYGISNFSDSHIANQIGDTSVMTDMNALFFAYTPAQWLGVFLWFLFCFVFGYLIFGALFAVVGAASDVDTETQQFIFPLTIPLIGTLVFSDKILTAPASLLAKTLSYFPLSSPIASPLRSTYLIVDAPWWETLTVIFFQLTGFLFITWVASRVYRIGILSYGKKVGFSDLAKWFFRKD